MAAHGYHGKTLDIDLTTGSFVSNVIDEEVLRHHIGGSGLGVRLLLDREAHRHEPFDSKSTIGFIFSPLVGSPLTTSAKFAVVNRSPLTMRFNDSLASSRFAINGKRTGHDAIMITGACETPSIIVVDESEVSLQSAKAIWGMTIPDSEQWLLDTYGDDYSAAVIGPAGENQVRFATISHDGRHAGRGGSGAILGSKNIKAILVRGSQRCEWADETGLVNYAKQLSKASFGPATAKYRELGTASNLLVFNRMNCLPTRNFTAGSMEGSESLSPQQLQLAHDKVQVSCAACTIGCTHIYGKRSGTSGTRIEYENIFALGPLCGITNQDTVIQASQLCDNFGMDTISVGGTIAFAMECAERGYLDDTLLRFGNDERLLQLIPQIANRTEMGALLANGSKRVAMEIGQDTIDFAPQVKGMEIPGYEPRALQTMALGFAVGARGADHNRSGAYEVDFSEQVDRKRADITAAALAIETEDKAAVIDSLILCKFLRGVFDDLHAAAADMLNLVTGWDINRDEIIESAKRIIDLKKQFNILAGWSPEEDTLPKRMLQTALADDPDASLSEETLQMLVKAYNRGRGWTDDGFLQSTTVHEV
ncbi:MAG: aldehyde ferredoxin oxidoreductase family protein [Pirellulales bacterium]|nr:aldehyde ferredoxin oxidoreductase family protein [Pirellulales bacterium]